MGTGHALYLLKACSQADFSSEKSGVSSSSRLGQEPENVSQVQPFLLTLGLSWWGRVVEVSSSEMEPH